MSSSSSSSGSGLVVDKSEAETGMIDMKKYGSAVVIVILIIVVASVAYCKTDSFTSVDGVVATSPGQVRSDTEVDRTWNLKQLEKSVALINRQAAR
jgi:hypothetical protein